MSHDPHTDNGAAAHAAAQEARLLEPPVAELDTIDDDHLRKVLEVNGFNAVRSEVLGVCQAAGAIPALAIDAALLYHDTAIARLRLDPDPQAKPALASAEAQGRYLRAVRKFRRELAELEERAAAAARIVAP